MIILLVATEPVDTLALGARRLCSQHNIYDYTDVSTRTVTRLLVLSHSMTRWDSEESPHNVLRFRLNSNDKEVIPRGLNSPSTDGKRPTTNRPSCFRANFGLSRGYYAYITTQLKRTPNIAGPRNPLEPPVDYLFDNVSRFSLFWL